MYNKSHIESKMPANFFSRPLFLVVLIICLGWGVPAKAWTPTQESLGTLDLQQLYEFWGRFEQRDPVMVSKGLSYLEVALDGSLNGFARNGFRQAYDSCMRNPRPMPGCVLEVVAQDHSFDARIRVRNWLGSRVFFFELLQNPLNAGTRINDFFDQQVSRLDPEAFDQETRFEEAMGVYGRQRIGLRLALGVAYHLKQACSIGLVQTAPTGALLGYGGRYFRPGPEGIYACKSKVATDACNALTKSYLEHQGDTGQEILLPALRSVCRMTDENGAFIEDRKGREN